MTLASLTPSRRTMKLLAISYAVKTVLVGVLWLVAPEIPEAVIAHARAAWAGAID
ncbi:MAG: hypothetical protein ABW221_01860 [Vicinamibacteria bacterium]